jgi:glycosyltransferase involved in cell wall biosynthesis
VVVTVCPDLHDYSARSGVPPERRLLIENSVFDDIRVRTTATSGQEGDVAAPVQFDPGHPVILYAGTFEVYQGVEMLVEAFARVVRQRREARLLLVGGSEDQVRKIREQVDSLGLGATCVLTGSVPKGVAVRYTQSASVLVSPRLHGTNTPLKIYEHLASGRPMVATRIWSHTQVLDDSVCHLVEPDPDSLAAGLIAALTDQSGSAERVRNAMALYERSYSRPQYEQKIRRLLEIIA